MIAAARKYELVTLELQGHYSELNPDLKRQFKKLLTTIRKDLIGGKEILISIDELIEEIFALRIVALKWLAGKPDFNLNQTLNDAEELNSYLSGDTRFELLSENLGFALRTIRRVTKGLLNQIPHKNDFTHNLQNLPELDYWTYFDLMSMSLPNEEVLDTVMEWVDSSIELEYGVLAASIIKNENLLVSSKTINELAELITLAAQDYSAYSVQLGIMPMYVARQEKNNAHL